MYGNYLKKVNKIFEKFLNGKRETKLNDLRVMNGICSNGDVGNYIDDKEVCAEFYLNLGEVFEKLLEIDNDKEMLVFFFDGQDEQDILLDIEYDKVLLVVMEEEESLLRQIEEWYN